MKQQSAVALQAKYQYPTNMWSIQQACHSQLAMP